MRCFANRRARNTSCAASLSISKSVAAVDARLAGTLADWPSAVQVTALRFDDAGLTMGVGLSTGHVLLYDLRARSPHLIRDHRHVSCRHSRTHSRTHAPHRSRVASAGVVVVWRKGERSHCAIICIFVFPSAPKVKRERGRRRKKTVYPKSRRYGVPIHSIKFHETAGAVAGATNAKKVISADSKVIKIWDKVSGDAFTAIEPLAGINDVCVVPDSGLIMAACEMPRMQVFYVPQLGPAPSWVSFLDSLTEEMEEQGATSSYDDYKFLTRDELEDLGISHLVGTNLLRAYMHGFFIDSRLYNQVCCVSVRASRQTNTWFFCRLLACFPSLKTFSLLFIVFVC